MKIKFISLKNVKQCLRLQNLINFNKKFNGI